VTPENQLVTLSANFQGKSAGERDICVKILNNQGVNAVIAPIIR